MPIVFDILILIVGYVVAFAVAEHYKSLQTILIPQTVDNKYEKGSEVIYRLVPFRDTKLQEPKWLVMLLVYVVTTFLAKVLFHNTASWSPFWTGFGIIIGFQLLSIFNLIILGFIGLIYLVPGAIAYFLNMSNAGIGVISGLLVGLYGGLFLGANYHLTRARVNRELEQGKTVDGESLTSLGTWWRKWERFSLKWAPWFTFVALLSFAFGWKSITTTWLAQATEAVQILALVAWLFISINIFFFALPLLVEMIQQASWLCAGYFNEEVKKGNDENYVVYVDGEGKFTGFSHGQTFIVAVMGLAMGATIGGGVLENLFAVKLLSGVGNADLLVISEVLAGFAFSIHLGFLISYMARSAVYPRVTVREIKDPEGLADKILGGEDAVSQYVWSKLSETQRDLLEKNKKSFVGKSLLANALEEVMEDERFYDPARFEGIELGEDVRRILANNPRGEARVRLNRLLLDDAYPDEIEAAPEVIQKTPTPKENILVMERGLRMEGLKVRCRWLEGIYPEISPVE